MRLSRLLVWIVPCLASAGALAASCDGFVDVDSTASYCTAVTYLKNTGITVGCTATTYCPNDSVTRAQMALYLYRMGNGVAYQQGGNAFGTTGVMGTTDANPLEIDANGSRVMRYEPNATSPNLIGGHANNSVASGTWGGTVSGGGTAGNTCLNVVDNTLTQSCGNQANGTYSTVGGGIGNAATALDSTIGGGQTNVASGPLGTVSGGSANIASGTGGSAIGGGYSNIASGHSAAIAGGYTNTASGDFSNVGGGMTNTASGMYSAVVGGNNAFARGYASLAFGNAANANWDGCSVIADNSSSNPTSCGANNEFIARAEGGFFIFTAGADDSTYTGTYVAPGSSSWTTYSDRNGKTNIVSVDTMGVLDKLAAIPVATWNWKTQQASIHHMGPMAQDFYAAFGLGETDRGISVVDAQGVALAAIQGLNAKLGAQLAERDLEIAALKQRLDKLEASSH